MTAMRSCLHKTTLDEIPALFQIATLSALLLWLAGDVLLTSGDYGRRQIFGMWSLLFVLLIVGRSLARHLAGRRRRRCAAWSSATPSRRRAGRQVPDQRHGPCRVAGRVPLEPSRDGGDLPPSFELPSSSARSSPSGRSTGDPRPATSTAMAPAPRAPRQRARRRVSVLPATPPVAGSAVEMDHINGLTLLGIHSFQMGRSSKLVKRGFDLVASSLLLLLLSPLLLAIALAIKLDSPGPILFRQRRIGRDGEPFEMLKFRRCATAPRRARRTAGAERGRRPLQARPRPRIDQGRADHPALVARRAPAAGQRPPRRDEPRRAAAPGAGGGLDDRRALPPPARHRPRG